MAKRIFEKAELIPGYQPGARGIMPTPEKDGKSKTAPGTMMGFLTAQSGASKEAEALRAEVDSLRRNAPLLKLDPTRIRPSAWANRHPSAFTSEDFEDLKLEIAAAAGNVQPIKVRPVKDGVVDAEGVSAGEATYELIYGHRRHRACLEMGLQVLAVVEIVDDVTLFSQMERENRGRANLSAWEQGKMYARALDEGLFPSLRKLSESLGVDLSQVSRTVSLARLPEEIIQAFESPLHIQFRWAAPLADALQKDPDGVLARAREVKGQDRKQAPAAVLDYLVKPRSGDEIEPASVAILKGGKAVGQLRIQSDGRMQLTVKAGVVTASRSKGLVKLIEDYLGK